MASVTASLMVVLVLLLLFVAGGILLQIFLSRRKSWWPGLILPLLSVLYSLVLVMNVAAMGGQIPWGPMLAAFVTGNIPTVILLAIYWAAREKLRVKDQIDKMNIDDL